MNASEQVLMGELRSLLQSVPNTAGQRRVFVKALAQLLDRFRPELLRDVVIDYTIQTISASPPLNDINLSPTDRWLSDFVRGVDVPQLALVTTIELGPRAQSPSLLAKVLRGDGFARLNHIRLRGWRLNAEYLDGLRHDTTKATLTSLELEQCICSPEWIEALVSWDGLDAVRSLAMPVQSLTSAHAVTLASRSALKLRDLSMSMYGQGRSTQALARLLEAPWVEGLRSFELDSLDVHSSRPDDEHVLLIASCARLEALESLSLRRFSMRVPGARALACSAAFDGLLRLDLSSCDTLGEAGLTPIMESPSIGELIELNLSDCGIGVGVRDLIEMDRLPSLRKLDLSYNMLIYEFDFIHFPPSMYGPIPAKDVHRQLFGHRADLELIYEQR